ncbi:MAG TPA: hypothetical protein VFA65_22095 [Bryobacteraceae bacterium]|nr:hypothetical protein [Bryobacteraceae bacterium]
MHHIERCIQRIDSLRFTQTSSDTTALVCWWTCYYSFVENTTDPKTPGQWVRYVIVAVIAIFLVYLMLRVYVL